MDNTIRHPDCPDDSLTWRRGMGRTVEILDIGVCNRHRRTGRGKELLTLLLEQIPQSTSVVFAITRMSNTVAHQFYESQNFRILGRLHAFYRDASDRYESALVYGLDL